MVWAFFRRAGCRLAGLGEWDFWVLGERDYYRAFLSGSGLAKGRFWLLSFIPGGFLGMTLFFASGMNWTVTLLGFLAGNCVGIISEYGGQKLSEATTKRDGY